MNSPAQMPTTVRMPFSSGFNVSVDGCGQPGSAVAATMACTRLVTRPPSSARLRPPVSSGATASGAACGGPMTTTFRPFAAAASISGCSTSSLVPGCCAAPGAGAASTARTASAGSTIRRTASKAGEQSKPSLPRRRPEAFAPRSRSMPAENQRPDRQ